MLKDLTYDDWRQKHAPHTQSITRGQMPGSLHIRRLHRESCALKQVGGSIYSHQREREVGSKNDEFQGGFT